MIQKKRVVITGIGAVTPLGVGIKESWRNLLAGKSAIVSLEGNPRVAENKCKVGALLPSSFNEKDYQTSFGDARAFSLANAVSKQAFEDAGLDFKNMPIDRQKFGVSIATLAETMDHAMNKSTTLFTEKSSASALSALIYFIPCSIAFNYNLCGQVNALTNGCAAGIMAIGEAYRLIQAGRMDAMIAGGADYSISRASLGLMERIGALPDTDKLGLKPEEVMRPFDEKRYGTILGDGGAMFVMESLDSALARNAKIYCEISGYHANCMGIHASRPDASGVSNFKTAQQVLLEAQVTPSEIDYINSHATATQLGDAAEAAFLKKMFYNEQIHSDLKALEKVIPEDIEYKFSDKIKRAPISAYKGNIGHLQLSSGSVETAFNIMCMKDNIIPNIYNLENPFDKELNLVKDKPLKHEINIMYKNAISFGSQYAGLVMKKYKE